jgi:hypothetical protein
MATIVLKSTEVHTLTIGLVDPTTRSLRRRLRQQSPPTSALT